MIPFSAAPLVNLSCPYVNLCLFLASPFMILLSSAYTVLSWHSDLVAPLNLSPPGSVSSFPRLLMTLCPPGPVLLTLSLLDSSLSWTCPVLPLSSAYLVLSWPCPTLSYPDPILPLSCPILTVVNMPSSRINARFCNTIYRYIFIHTHTYIYIYKYIYIYTYTDVRRGRHECSII
jgi:hypothetical protein